MSVAFRRDSDEEHLEPKFELPIPPGPNLVTPRGLALIEARNAELQTAIAAAAPEQLPELQRDLRYWRARLTAAQLAPAPSGEIVASYRCDQAGGKTRTLVRRHDDSDRLRPIAFTARRRACRSEPVEEIESPGPGTITSSARVRND